MTEFLVRRFVPDAEKTTIPAVRQAYGRLSGMVGIGVNLLLATGKLGVGLATGAISVIADAFNNFSDVGSSVVTLIGFHIAGKAADADHPFGHGRMEYLSGLFVSLLICLVGVELLQSSVEKILHPTPVSFTWMSAVILAVSVGVKLWLCLFNRRLGRRIGSEAMEATSIDSLSDAVATGVLLVGLLAGHFFDLALDGWLGVLVALFILRSGWKAVKETVDPLLGKPASPELVREMKRVLLSYEGISGIHDLVIHDYGPGRRMVSLHAEVSADCDIMTAHDMIDAAERALRREFGVEAVIHMDPVRCDALTLQLREKVSMLVHAIDPVMTIHDFRLTSGSDHTNLIFDVVVPYGFRLGDEQIKDSIQVAVSALDSTYRALVEIDRAFSEE